MFGDYVQGDFSDDLALSVYNIIHGEIVSVDFVQGDSGVDFALFSLLLDAISSSTTIISLNPRKMEGLSFPLAFVSTEMV